MLRSSLLALGLNVFALVLATGIIGLLSLLGAIEFPRASDLSLSSLALAAIGSQLLIMLVLHRTD